MKDTSFSDGIILLRVSNTVTQTKKVSLFGSALLEGIEFGEEGSLSLDGIIYQTYPDMLSYQQIVEAMLSNNFVFNKMYVKVLTGGPAQIDAMNRIWVVDHDNVKAETTRNLHIFKLSDWQQIANQKTEDIDFEITPTKNIQFDILPLTELQLIFYIASGVESLSFAKACEAMQRKIYVRRVSWPEGMFIYLGEKIQFIHAHFIVKYPDGALQVGWLPTAEDILAKDWQYVNKKINTYEETIQIIH